MLCLLLLFELIASTALAAESCGGIFSAVQNQSRYESTYNVIGNEFAILLNDFNMEVVHKALNSKEVLKSSDEQNFLNTLSELTYSEPRLSRQIEDLLNIQITNEQAIALKLARALGRNEIGADGVHLAFKDNYSVEQLNRKKRILSLSKFTPDQVEDILKSRLVEEDLTLFTGNNLMLDNMIVDKDLAIKMNRATIERMNHLNVVGDSKTGLHQRKKVHQIDFKLADSIYEKVTRHPVSRLLKAKKYDPYGLTGFCFGRAMVAHIEALTAGVDPQSIRKVFAVGDMKAIWGDIVWQFHVAVSIKGTDGHWWVIDPFVGKVITLEEWTQKMYAQDTKGSMRLYVTEPSRFAAGSTQIYSRQHMLEEYYNDYFVDLMKHYRKSAEEKENDKKTYMKVVDSLLKSLRLGL